MTQLNEKEIVVGPVRLSYLSVFQPKMNDQRGEEEFSVTLLFPKADNEFQPNADAEIRQVADALKAIKTAKFGADFKGVWASALKDGDKDLRKSDAEPKAPGYWFMNVRAKSQYPPKLMDGSLKPVTGGWGSGDWGNVKLSLFGYDTAGNKGVSAGLIGIQFLYKGEPMGGGTAAAEGFGAVANAHSGTIATAATSNANVTQADEYDPFADE